MVKHANTIGELRSLLGLSQTEFSKMIGVTQVSLSYYETGKRKPSWRVCYLIKNIAKVAGISIEFQDIHPE